jgi:hypothetical protein
LPILKITIEIVAVGKNDKGGSIGDIVFPVAETEHELVVEDYADAVYKVVANGALDFDISKVHASEVGLF